MSVRFTRSLGQWLTTSVDPLYNAAYTDCGWIRLYRTGLTQTAASRYRDGNNFDVLWYSSALANWGIRTASAGTADDLAAGSAGVSINTWYYLAMMRHSATSMELFIGTTASNIASVATNAKDVSARAAGTTVQYGNVIAGANILDGDLVGWKRFPTDLTLTQLKAEALRCSPEAGNVPWYPLRFESDYQNYLTPGTNDLTVTGGPLATSDDPPNVTAEFFVPPTSDVAIGGWTTDSGGTSNLFSTVNEADPAVDSGYSKTVLAPSADTLKFAVNPPSAPGAGPWMLAVRHKKF